MQISEPIELRQHVLDGIEILKQNLSVAFEKSDQIILNNLISETKNKFREIADNSKSYYERYEIASFLFEQWSNAWRKYNHLPSAIELIKFINDITDYILAYSYLCLSISLINEGKTGDSIKDLEERVLPGFELLAEVTEVFYDFFSESLLTQILSSAKDILLSCSRNRWEYFEEGRDRNSLSTKLKAYSSLIIHNIEESKRSGSKEQLELNQPAIKLLESWMSEQSNYSEAEKKKNDFLRFQKIVNENRPMGQEVFGFK
jgi:hypothetical protein